MSLHQLEKDFAELKTDEELIILLNGRQYVVRVANENDAKNHGVELINKN